MFGGKQRSGHADRRVAQRGFAGGPDRPGGSGLCWRRGPVARLRPRRRVRSLWIGASGSSSPIAWATPGTSPTAAPTARSTALTDPLPSVPVAPSGTWKSIASTRRACRPPRTLARTSRWRPGIQRSGIRRTTFQVFGWSHGFVGFTIIRPVGTGKNSDSYGNEVSSRSDGLVELLRRRRPLARGAEASYHPLEFGLARGDSGRDRGPCGVAGGRLDGWLRVRIPAVVVDFHRR